MRRAVVRVSCRARPSRAASDAAPLLNHRAVQQLVTGHELGCRTTEIGDASHGADP